MHLAPGVPERMEAFRSVCQMVEDLDCSALLICGDLFDSTAAAQDLRVEVRELFDSLGKDVFLIPGNHDLQAFQSGEYYGRDVHICKYPVRWELEGVPLLGIPYLPGRQGIEALRSLVHGEESPFIALMHTDFYNSSLSACFFAEEKDDQGSACLWDRDLEQFPLSYIALGHWHNPTRPPIKINNTLCGFQCCSNGFQKGGFARGIGPHDTQKTTGSDVQAYPFEGLVRSITAFNTMYLKNHIVHHLSIILPI